jgi:hypothetical protein
MTIEIRSPGTPTLSRPLGTVGEVEVFVPARVHARFEGGRVDNVNDAIAMRWLDAPRGARMSQLISLRAFWMRHDTMTVPVEPSSPHTDIRLAGDHVSHPLSPPAPHQRLWHVDAVPDPERRDLGRAYVTDESYGFSERSGSTIVFYDAPNLALHDAPRALREAGLNPSECPGYELIALFHTAFWHGHRRLGVVSWSCA